MRERARGRVKSRIYSSFTQRMLFQVCYTFIFSNHLSQFRCTLVYCHAFALFIPFLISLTTTMMMLCVCVCYTVQSFPFRLTLVLMCLAVAARSWLCVKKKKSKSEGNGKVIRKESSISFTLYFTLFYTLMSVDIGDRC